MQQNFSKPSPMNDLAIFVEDGKLYCNRGILSVWSKFFEKMFTSDFKEKNLNEITLKDKSYDEIFELLCVIYPPNKPIDDKNIESMLKLADEYDISELTERCRVYLMKQKNTVDILALVEPYNLKDISDKCIEILHQTSIFKMEESVRFKEIHYRTINPILIKKIKSLECDLENAKEQIKEISKLENENRLIRITIKSCKEKISQIYKDKAKIV